MLMNNSILRTTKKLLNVDPDDKNFEDQILTHINAALGTLTSMGVGPAEGLYVTDDSAEWTDFVTDPKMIGILQEYVCVRCRPIFDAPSTSFVADSLKKREDELAFWLQDEATYGGG